jgi:hypothetical protein
MRTRRPSLGLWSGGRSPRFRRAPFLRDVVSDPGRATAPRIMVPHMLPSTLLTASASASCWISWLNRTPHRIAVYASPTPSPAPTQHSLPGGRYPLPGPDLHRQDHASLPGAQAIQPFSRCAAGLLRSTRKDEAGIREQQPRNLSSMRKAGQAGCYVSKRVSIVRVLHGRHARARFSEQHANSAFSDRQRDGFRMAVGSPLIIAQAAIPP